ncbi:UDP-2,4-diacetamido-2,4,6-trideoxy-beta-L-altropyranose hydrolase [Nostoc punctiforme]|uniref:Glycosyltransferase 28, C-terminal domain protein n=1 Tax=Nostoc punctiforme (strain ATCC 29133 / PCC 73102) TaxID=63737 RepID=B2J9E0_NOSP7|nr:UDP-2,4-diacetamido-2,4,6-trideoxy-beta-L-altropyranose hydrolase [Nostoc punctiforme]ACC79439.1 Glycosyltransferase 28, C-terminal domain protein [Nostoc punctiforme PCC 73102]
MKLFIRVDASTQIGTGHVMRCLALAQAWQDAGGQVVFVMATEAPDLKTRLNAEGMEVIHLPIQIGSAEDAKETAKLARQFNANWVVVDGYNFGAKYQEIIKESDLKLLFIDDYGHAEYYYADVVLNQDIYAHENLYMQREPYTKLLLGINYALLRREFSQYQREQKTHPLIVKKLLVTLGGSDLNNLTLKVINALKLLELSNLEVLVVVGGSNPHYEKLQVASQHLQFPIYFHRNVQNMPNLMAWSDIAISASGSTIWELAFMGLPSLILILADNQASNAKKLGEMRLIYNLGEGKDIAPIVIANALKKLMLATKERTEMARLCQNLVDGQGSRRVLNQILHSM